MTPSERDAFAWERTLGYRDGKWFLRELVDDTILYALRHYEHDLQYRLICTKADREWRENLAKTAAARGLEQRLLKEGVLL